MSTFGVTSCHVVDFLFDEGGAEEKCVAREKGQVTPANECLQPRRPNFCIYIAGRRSRRRRESRGGFGERSSKNTTHSSVYTIKKKPLLAIFPIISLFSGRLFFAFFGGCPLGRRRTCSACSDVPGLRLVPNPRSWASVAVCRRTPPSLPASFAGMASQFVTICTSAKKEASYKT